jgi:hypothetical protein
MKRLLMLLTILMLIALPVLAESAEPVPLIDLTPLFQAIVALLAGLITYKLIPWIKAHTSEAQQITLETAARIGVFAAEQLYGASRGDQKLKYVRAFLRGKGYDVNAEEVKNTIEAMVQELSLLQPDKFIEKPPNAERIET